MITRQSGYRWAAAVTAVLLTGWTASWLLEPSLEEQLTEGRDLFLHEWVPDDELAGDGDGLGPVFNAQSCVACHFQGGVGGGGDTSHNVTAFQVLPNRHNDELQGGVIHSKALLAEYHETADHVRRLHPIIPASTRVVGNCFERIDPFDPLVINHINTPALYGAGLIDQISDFAIRSGRRSRLVSSIGADFNLEFDHIKPGRLPSHGIKSVGRFGWRGQFATLEGFVATACAVELGLTNPQRAQDIPLQHVANEDAELDMTARQLESLVTFCRNLPRPQQILPTQSDERAAVIRGEAVFAEIGCAVCHQPDIGGVEGVYSDFLLYSLGDGDGVDDYGIEFLEVPLPESMPLPNEWQTPPLWGVADSAPYFHDGQAATLKDAIERHHGQASPVRERFRELRKPDQHDLIMFLRSLRAPVEAEAVPVAEL